MRIHKILIIVTAIIAATAISACTPVDRVLSNNNAFALNFVNSNGQFIVVNVKTGKIVPPCSKRPVGEYGACKRPEGFYNKDKYKSISSAKDIASNVGESSVTKRVTSSHLVLITSWRGSVCDTMDAIFAGLVFEICN